MGNRSVNQELLRDFGRLTVVIVLALALYTFAIAVIDRSQLLGWINTLVATGLSVFFALLVGLLLFNYQSRQTSRERKGDLCEALQTELSEVKRVLENLRSSVPVEALEMTSKKFSAHEMKVSTHYTHPLIVEEAVRSGLFRGEQLAEMLALARNMRSHNVRVQEFISMGPQLEDAWPEQDRYPEGFERYVNLYVSRAEAGRSVERSEQRIIDGCAIILENLISENNAAKS